MDSYQLRQKIIDNYISAYNDFNINGMLKDLHENVQFENISNGAVNLKTHGIKEFKDQAESAKDYFKERKQKVINFKNNKDTVEIHIGYTATLAKDLPNGLKSGDKLELKGKSIFKFNDNKIISIRDIS